MTTSTLDTAFIDRYRRPMSLGNPIRDANPLVMFAIIVLMAIMALVLPAVIGPAAICVACVVIAFFAGVGPTYAKNYGRLFALIAGILFIVRVGFATDTKNALWAWGPFAVTVRSIVDAAQFALAVAALCGVLTLFFAVTPTKHLMLALERVGVSPKASYVVLASFQAITDLGANSRTVMDAQKSRGIETEGSLLRRAGAFFPIITPVFLAAMSNTEERALALDARAFNAPGQHTHLVILPKVGAGQWVTLAVVVALTALAVVGKVLLWH